jgi:uncharacterized protein (DUF433 family)
MAEISTSAPKSGSLIVSLPNVLGGKPHIIGTVLAVDLIQSLVATGWTKENLLETYPYLLRAEIEAALVYPLR